MVEDVDGNKFLDWVGGVGVLNIGFSHPEVVEAVKAQADKYFHCMFNVGTHEGYVALAEKLSQIAPVKGEHKKAYFANSGSKADENAVKIVKAYTKQSISDKIKQAVEKYLRTDKLTLGIGGR